MGRAPLAVFLAVLVVALVPTLAYLSEPREVIVSTPSAYTGLTVPLLLPAGGEACADEILYDTNGRIARFGATAPDGARAPALEVVARGYDEGPYRNAYESTARIAGGWSGTRQLDARIEPPLAESFGTFCVRNRGTRPLELVGSEDGRAFSRPTVKVNGEPTPIELQLRFLAPGERSLLARAGQVLEQAATLKPFGSWWWWTLAVAGITLVPFALLLAVRGALGADERAGLLGSTTLLAHGPPARARRLGARVPGWGLVAAGSVPILAWLLFWSLNTHVFQLDEDQYVYLSRWLQDDFPASLWNFEVYGRGLQRLEVWLLALPSVLFDGPWSLIGGRVLNVAAFVSTAIPVYLLGRAQGLAPRVAALPALLSVVGPWAVVTTSFLTENVAYPACLWALWAISRTVAAPGVRSDLLAMALIFVAGTARSALLLLAPVLPLAVLATSLRCGAGSVAGRLRGALRDHPVLWATVALAALPLILAPLGVGLADTLISRVAGGYPTQVDVTLRALLSKSGEYFSRSVVGTGFLPAALALPWLLTQLLRPRDRNRFAFAATVVLAAGALLYSLVPAGPDERYIIYFAPLLLLPAALAVAHREVAPVGLGIASVLLAVLLARVGWNPDQGAFAFFVSPVEMFYSRAVGLRLANYLPGDGGDVLQVVAGLLGAGGVALALVLRRSAGGLSGDLAAALVVAVAAVIALQTQYTMTKFVNGAGSRSAEGWSGRSFVDRAVPPGATVGQFAEGRGLAREFQALWREVQFYNEKIETVFIFGNGDVPSPPGDTLVAGVAHDERSGRVESPSSLPEHLVVPAQFGEAGLRGEIVSAPAYVPVVLLRIDGPASLAWHARGFGPEGTVREPGDAEVRFFGAGAQAGPECAVFTLAAPADRSATWRFIRAGTTSRGRLRPGERRNVKLPVRYESPRRFVDVEVDGTALQVLNLGLDDSC